jgi:hypothetical protein
MWDRVAFDYNSKEERSKRRMQAMPVRDVDSIRTKWKALKNCKKPTGDPDCPKEVRRAKRIQREIENGAGVFNLDDSDDDSSDNNDNNDDSSSSSSVHSPVCSRPAINPHVIAETLDPRSDVVPESILVTSSAANSDNDDADQGNPAMVSDAQIMSPVKGHESEEEQKKKLPNLLRNSPIHLV